jgi:hypothetical protein
LDNPLSVTGSGGSEQIEVKIEGAGTSIDKAPGGKGQYIVKCAQSGRATVIATDNKSKTTSRIEIPIKRVPNPLATVGGIASGSMSVAKFKAQPGVIANLGDFVFDGVKFTVVSYFIMFTGAGFPEPATAEVSGAAFSGQVAKYKQMCEEGTTVIIGNIKVDGPGGSRTLEQGITLVLE